MGYSPWGRKEWTQLSRLSTQHPPGGSGDKDCPCQCRDSGDTSPLDWVDPLEKEMPTYSSILPWEIPWTEEPGGLHTGHGASKSWTRLSTAQADMKLSRRWKEDRASLPTSENGLQSRAVSAGPLSASRGRLGDASRSSAECLSGPRRTERAGETAAPRLQSRLWSAYGCLC